MSCLGFVLLTHANPPQVERLIVRLNQAFEGPPIVCHHDFGQCHLDTGRFPGNVRFVRPHLPTRWGHFSVVLATIAALWDLYERQDGPDWFTILSGADYPVAPASKIVAEVRACPGDAFMHHEEIVPGQPRRYWHRLCEDRFLRPTAGLPDELGRQLLPFSPSFRLFAGSQWFTARRRCARLILDRYVDRTNLARHFQTTFVPDEAFFQCILCNEPSLQIVNDNKRYVDWESGPTYPRVLNVADLPRIDLSGSHFARKFAADTDPGLLDALDERFLAA